MTTHPIDTEALRRLADAATAGPWENARNGVQQSLDAATKAGDYRYEGVGIVPEEYVRQDDAEFIAAARTAVPALLDALAAAEHRATRAEARAAIRGRAVVIYRERARQAEADRDWNLRSSRQAKEGRIKASARADEAEARIVEEKRLRMEVVAAVTEAEARIKAWAQQYDYDMCLESDRADAAEARIKAVQDLIDQADTAGDWTVTCSRLQWAIDGTNPRETFK